MFKIELMCEKGKEYQSQRSESSIQRETGTVKTDCPFGLVANYYKTYDIWRLRVQLDEHNHPYAPTLEGHPYAMRLEPVVHKNTRGRPSTKDKKKQTHQFVTQNADPHRNLNKPICSPSCRSKSSKDFPTTHLPYKQCEGDGNCGFRSVAVGIDLRENMWPAIRQNLLQALDNYEMLFTEMWLSDGFQRIRHTVDHFGLGIAPRDKWMCMPDTGLVIASLYNQPVIFISPEQSNMCFPLWHGPDRPQPKRPIVIALVGGIHYINLTLYENSPIPPNHPQWRWYASGNAQWEDIYSNRHRVC
ncbi:hypothetical protein Tco_0956960 [Tanacetum coccineum]